MKTEIRRGGLIKGNEYTANENLFLYEACSCQVMNLFFNRLIINRATKASYRNGPRTTFYLIVNLMLVSRLPIAAHSLRHTCVVHAQRGRNNNFVCWFS